MKRFFKVITIVIVFVLAFILILPLFFKAEIVEIVKHELNKQVNAKVDFADADLSLIRHFPDFTLDLNQLSIIGTDAFEDDTLLNLEALSLRIDVLKALNGDYVIKELRFYKPFINLLVNKEGLANWDIAAPSETADAPVEETSTEAIQLKIKQMSLKDGTLKYIDQSMDLLAELHGMELSMKGDLSTDKSSLATRLTAKSFDLSFESFPYFNGVAVRFNAMFLIDLANSIYTFKENQLVLNDLLVNFEGSVGMNPDSYTLLLNFDAPKSEFRQLISLIPAFYKNDFDKFQANGNFQLDGFVRGTYSENQLPAYGLNLKVDNASFGYPELPARVETLNLNASVNNKTGETDDAEIEISDFNWQLAGQPFRMNLSLKTPVSDPQFNISTSGVLDFGQLTALLPDEQKLDLQGLLKADFRIKGKMSDIENNRFDQVNASGSLVLQNFEFADSTVLSLPVKISNAQLNLSPKFIDLLNTSISIGRSDIRVDGRIEDYLPYALADGTLTGRLNHKSTLLDVDELMTLTGEEQQPEGSASDSSEFVLELPKNLIFDFESNIQNLIFEPYELTAVKAKLHYENQEIKFEEFAAEFLDGKMNMNGTFAALQDMPAQLEVDFKLTDLDIPKAWKTIELLQKTVPIAQQAKGTMTAQFEVTTKLDAEFSPVYESMQGGGILKTSQLSISNLSSLQKLNALLGTQQFDQMVTDGLNISFEFINGRVYQKPFNVKLGGQETTISGSTGFDQTLDYDLFFKVPYGKLGSSIQKGITDLAGLAGNTFSVNPEDEMQIKAKMTGTTSDPVFSIDYKDYASNLKQQIKDQISQKIEEEKEKLREQSREEAAKILNQAQAKADKLIAEAASAAQKIREEGASAAQRVRTEAEAQAANVIAEGKKNGILAEAAAKEVAKKIRSEADNQAKNLEQQTNQRADQVESEAQRQADNIMQQAQQQADKL
ncbi:MAG: AsmA-like C-terminal region-containing protein [Bacteroidales bacterium]